MYPKRFVWKSVWAVIIFNGVVTSGCMSSCGNSAADEERVRMQQQLDSLNLVNEGQKRELNELSSFMEIVSQGLDSISMYEDNYLNVSGPERRRLTRRQLRERIDGFAQLLDRQRQRIAMLEDSLQSMNGESVARLRNIINFLNVQLDEKNRTIDQLRSELRYRNVDISRLRSKMDTLTQTNENLISTVRQQTEALTVQDVVINECYIKIGTKKELQNAGILTKGKLFRKAKLNVAGLNPSQFNAVDIRNFTQVDLPSNKVKILTQMPQSSYQLVKNGDVTTLHIINTTEFWSISNYLVIQID